MVPMRQRLFSSRGRMRFENQDVLLYSVLHLWLDYTNILTQNIVLSDHDHFTFCHVASESQGQT